MLWQKWHSVDGTFHSFTTMPLPTGRRGRPSRMAVPLTEKLLPSIATAVKEAGTAAITTLMQQLDSRFPPHQVLSALSIVYPKYWQGKFSMLDFKAKLSGIMEYYCQTRKGPGGQDMGPMLDGTKLEWQSSLFIRSMTELTKKVMAEVEAAGSDNEDEETLTVRVWQRRKGGHVRVWGAG